MLEEPGTSCTECVDDYWPDAVCDEPTFKHVARFAVPEDDCAIQGGEKGAKFPTSKASISVAFHSFRLIFGRSIISRSVLEALILFMGTRARNTHVEATLNHPFPAQAPSAPRR